MSSVLVAKDISNEEYHAMPGVSNSKLSDYIDDPRYYWWKYISGSYVDVAKDHFDFGSAVHQICLEQSMDGIICIPSEVLTKDGKRAGNAWKEFASQNEGKLLLKQSDYAAVLRCVDSVLGHSIAGELLRAPGVVEKTFCYHDGELGLDLRCKPDKLVMWNGKRVGLDLKTCTDSTPKKFVKSIVNFGYHRQEWFYRKVLANVGLPVDAYVFIAVCDAEPHTVDCYTLSKDFLGYAESECEPALESLADRYRRNDWSTSSANNLISLDPPSFLKYLGEYAV